MMKNTFKTAQDAICGVLPDAVDTTSPHTPTGVLTRADGTPLNAMQQTLYARYGVVIEPLPPAPHGRTDGERRALDWQRHKYAHGEFRQSVREFRRWLASQQMDSDGENEGIR